MRQCLSLLRGAPLSLTCIHKSFAYQPSAPKGVSFVRSPCLLSPLTHAPHITLHTFFSPHERGSRANRAFSDPHHVPPLSALAKANLMAGWSPSPREQELSSAPRFLIRHSELDLDGAVPFSV